jgi:hypothetical protein
MQKNIVGLVIAAVLLVGAGAYILHLRAENERLTVKPGATPAAAPDEPSTAGRVLTAEQRKAMIEKLDIRGGTTHSVWFAVVPNSEALNFQKQIQSVFEEAGWKVGERERVSFSLKPGLFFFIADEDPPDYVQSIADAFEAAGIEITTGRGYREFYEEKKKDNPNWNGFALKPDQDFILVIGRKPEE